VQLTVLGALAELAGLSLVLLDAGDARRDARSVVRKAINLYPSPARARVKFGIPTIVTGYEPTLEERVATLEADLWRFRGDLDDRIDKVDDAAQEAASQARGEAMKHADDLDRKLRDFIAGSLSSGRIVAGVAFFVFGVIASATANLV
jgi:hypothetical protein